MNQQDIYKKVQEFIVKGNHDAIFKILNAHQPSNAVTLLETEWNELQNKELKGILDPQQIQINRNQINDKLLILAKNGNPNNAFTNKKNNTWKIVLPFVILLLGGLYWWMNSNTNDSCPSYPSGIQNKILIVPFINIGDRAAKPQVGLRDRINNLAKKNNLSIDVQIGSENDDLTMNKAPTLAANCQADVIVWGAYEKSDSLNVVYNYYFSKQPTWSNSAELITLKDVASIYKGSMSKDLEDAVFSLCGIIVLRDGNSELAKEWLEKVKQKEAVDDQILKALN